MATPTVMACVCASDGQHARVEYNLKSHTVMRGVPTKPKNDGTPSSLVLTLSGSAVVSSSPGASSSGC